MRKNENSFEFVTNEAIENIDEMNEKRDILRVWMFFK